MGQGAEMILKHLTHIAWTENYQTILSFLACYETILWTSTSTSAILQTFEQRLDFIMIFFRTACYNIPTAVEESEWPHSKVEIRAYQVWLGEQPSDNSPIEHYDYKRL